MTKKTILITGCSSGIGYDAAFGLRERGWHVFASCRKPTDCEHLKEMGFDSPHLDYDDDSTISAAVQDVLETTGGRLDALFNNGAFGCPGAVEDLPRGALQAIFETNLFGVHELTRQIVPVMRKQGHGRIVQCSSVLGLTAMKWRGAYVATKFALEGLSDTLRLELRDSGIKVSLIEPGPITTKIRQNAIPHFERWIDWENSALVDQYKAGLVRRLYKNTTKKDTFELPPSAVTAKLVHAIESPRPRARYYVTTPTYIAGALKRVLPTGMQDWIRARG